MDEVVLLDVLACAMEFILPGAGQGCRGVASTAAARSNYAPRLTDYQINYSHREHKSQHSSSCCSRSGCGTEADTQSDMAAGVDDADIEAVAEEDTFGCSASGQSR